MNLYFPDAIIALCHFCENHGPRVIMTTQALKTTGKQRHESKNGEKNKEEESGYKLEVLSVNEFGKDEFEMDPQTTNEDMVFASWDRTTEPADDESRCEACSSVGPNAAHIANDYAAKRSYVTTQTAINEEAFVNTQSACLKAFMAEHLLPLNITNLDDVNQESGVTTTDRNKLNDDDDGIIYFGKCSDQYTVIGRMFVLKDAKSRGFKRRYALLCISQNHHLMTWRFKDIVVELNVTADLMKLSAEQVYDHEQDIDQEKIMRTNQVLRWIQGYERPKIQYDTKRSLTKIVESDDVFFMLHRDFVSTLQSLFKTKRKRLKPHSASRIGRDRTAEKIAEALAVAATQDLTVIYMKMLSSVFADLLSHLVRGGQLVCLCDYPPVRMKFLFAFTVLLPSALTNLAPNESVYSVDKNLLGVGTKVPLPSVEQHDIAIVKLKKTHENECYGLIDFDVNVDRIPQNCNDLLPSIVSKYMNALENKMIYTSYPVLHKALVTIKAEFMNMVNSISFSYPTTARANALLKIFAKPASDFDVYQFWKQAKLRKPRDTWLDSIPEEVLSSFSESAENTKPLVRKVSASIPIPPRESSSSDYLVNFSPPSVTSNDSVFYPDRQSTSTITSVSPLPGFFENHGSSSTSQENASQNAST